MRLWLGVLAAIALLGGVASASDEEVLAQVRLGMYRRYRSITSCKGSVRLVTTRPAEDVEKLLIVQVLTAAFDGERLRVSGRVSTGAAADFDGFFDGKTTTEWVAALDPPERVYDGLDGITSGMFSLFVDPRAIGGLPLASADSWPDGGVAIIGREAIDGSDCLVVELTGSQFRTRLWVDMAAGFAVRRLRLWYVRTFPLTNLPIPVGSVLLRDETVELRLYGEKLWGPAAFTRIDYNPDGSVEKKVYGTYEPGFEINQPISEEDLQLVLPSDTAVPGAPTSTPAADPTSGGEVP